MNGNERALQRYKMRVNKKCLRLRVVGRYYNTSTIPIKIQD